MNAKQKKYIELKKLYLKLKKQYGGISEKKLELTSNLFENTNEIKKEFTKYNKNITPTLEWKNIPKITDNLLLICYDPDAIPIVGKTWIHWFVYDINKNSIKLIEGNHKDGFNSFGNKGYDGPKPPKGTGIHHYYFKLYALNKKINLTNEYYEYNDIINKLINEKMIIEEAVIVGLSGFL